MIKLLNFFFKHSIKEQIFFINNAKVVIDINAKYQTQGAIHNYIMNL